MASTCHCRQTSTLPLPPAPAPSAPAAASPANAVFPPTAAADNGHRSGKSPLENCLPAARDRDESHPPQSLPPLSVRGGLSPTPQTIPPSDTRDRKSTRLNSSHLVISYAVFCLK